MNRTYEQMRHPNLGRLVLAGIVLFLLAGASSWSALPASAQTSKGKVVTTQRLMAAATKRVVKKRVTTTKRVTAKKVTTTLLNEPAAGGQVKFVAEVWADNWFSLSVNGTNVGEDSVPITTERSFNAETITFSASYPLTVAIEAKDFKQTDSGIEYIGKQNQQMGDGGLIAQITDASTGRVVSVTNAAWKTLVIHRAPLNPTCEKDVDPDKTCVSESKVAPTDWTKSTFDDSSWTPATIWSADQVSPKGGYSEVKWSSSAALIWGSDLEIDNTVLLRATIDSPR